MEIHSNAVTFLIISPWSTSRNLFYSYFLLESLSGNCTFFWEHVIVGTCFLYYDDTSNPFCIMTKYSMIRNIKKYKKLHLMFDAIGIKFT